MRIRLFAASVLALLAGPGLGPGSGALASTETTWSVSAHAAAETTHARTGSPRAAAALELAGDAAQQRDPVLHLTDDTGMGIWAALLPWSSAEGTLRLAGGGDGPGLGSSARGQARIIDMGISGIPGPGSLLSLGSLDLSYQLDWHLRPSLSRRHDLLRRPYTRQEYGVAMHGWRLDSGPSYYQLADIRVHTTFLEVHDPSALEPRTEHRIGVAVFTMQRTRPRHAPPFALDVLVVDVTGVDGSTDATVGGIDFARVRGLRLGGGLFADVAAGVSGTGTLVLGSESADGSTTSTTITTEDLPIMSTGVGHARIHGERGPLRAALEAGRSLYLTYDLELALEERVAGRLDWRGAAGALAVEAFAARTHLWLDRDTRETTLTGGASTSFRRRLTDNLDLGMSVEVARSFYAALDGDVQPHAELALRATTSMSGHFGSAR